MERQSGTLRFCPVAMDSMADWATLCSAMLKAYPSARKPLVGCWSVRSSFPRNRAHTTDWQSEHVTVSEKTNNLQPIVPHALSVSPDGHVLLSLETHAGAGSDGGGRDLFAWGTNYDYQVGNGRRASIAVPTTLKPAEGPGDRIMLEKCRAKLVRDPQGRVWRRGVNVEQVAAGGYGTSLVYWRIA